MKLDELYNLRDELTEQVANIDLQIAAQQSILRSKVKQTKNGNTYTFTIGERVVKARKGAYGRYKIWEGKRIIEAESLFHNINSIRLDLAMGNM
jgi:hypothetical protein